MPMPEAHVNQLQELTNAISTLAQFSTKRRNPETPGFREIADVLRNPAFKSTIDRFHDDKEFRDSTPRNATDLFKSQGVEIPSLMQVTLVNPNWRVSLCVTLNTDYGTIQLGVHYDQDEGFGWGC